MKSTKNITLLVFISVCFILVGAALMLNIQDALQSTSSQSSSYLVVAAPTWIPTTKPTDEIDIQQPGGTPTPSGIQEED